MGSMGEFSENDDCNARVGETSVGKRACLLRARVRFSEGRRRREEEEGGLIKDLKESCMFFLFVRFHA